MPTPLFGGKECVNTALGCCYSSTTDDIYLGIKVDDEFLFCRAQFCCAVGVEPMPISLDAPCNVKSAGGSICSLSLYIFGFELKLPDKLCLCDDKLLCFRQWAARPGLQWAPASAAAHCRLREVTRAEEGDVCWLADAA